MKFNEKRAKTSQKPAKMHFSDCLEQETGAERERDRGTSSRIQSLRGKEGRERERERNREAERQARETGKAERD